MNAPFHPATSVSLAVSLALVIAVPALAVETPYTPFKDGYADVSSVSGVSRTLLVRAGDTKAWVVHALADGAGEGLVAARLSLYVKDIRRDGTLKLHLASPFRAPEANTPLSQLRNAAADPIGSISLRANDHIQSMVSIPLGTAFLKSVQDGTHAGLILEGADGLDAELGAIEGGRGALLYLDFQAGTTNSVAVIDSVAARVVANHRETLRGPAGMKGDKGDKGDRGDPGAAADQAPIFNLLVDRGARAKYTFDAFSASTPRTTPDSSGSGNGLTLSTDGVNRIENQSGDSAIQFLGNGHGAAADAPSLNPYREISLAARVRLSTEAPPDTQTLISKPNQYELAVIGGTLRARFKTVLSDWAWIGAGSVPGGRWVDVRATYDGKALRTFVNGQQTFYAPSAAGPLVSGGDPLYVGARGANVHGLKGFLDNVEILAYAVQSQDSLAMLPGKASRAQLSLDSIPGMQAALDAKANLNGAVFTGRIRIGTDSAARASIMKIDGNGNANIELRSHGAYPYIDFATNQAADYNSRIILGADSVLSLISNKSIAVSPGLDVSGPIRRQGKTILDRGNTLVVSKLFEPSPYWTPSATGMREVQGFSANIDVPVPGTIIAHLNALVGHQGEGAAIYIGPAIDGSISNGNQGGYRNKAGGGPRWFGAAAVNSRHVEAGNHTVQAMANVDGSTAADIAWGNLLVQFIPD